MLGDGDKKNQMLSVDKVFSIRLELPSIASLNLGVMTKSRNEKHSLKSAAHTSSTVRMFGLPIN